MTSLKIAADPEKSFFALCGAREGIEASFDSANLVIIIVKCRSDGEGARK